MTYSDFLSQKALTENQVGVIEYLDKQFLSQAGVERTISYRVPFYKLNKRICYINPKKNGHIELCFMNGKPLSKQFSTVLLLKRKWIGGIMVDCDSDLDIKYLMKVYKAALKLDHK